MRVLLFTGKGGVGTTTTAAATAARAAASGTKTLLLSTDRAPGLADTLGCPLGEEPIEVDTGLYAGQVDPQRGLERGWPQIAAGLGGALGRAGAEELRVEELTVLPGAPEVLALLELRTQAASGRFELVVVDCPAAAATLRLLALPEAVGRYVEKVLPPDRRALRPLLGRPGDGELVEAVLRLSRDLAEVRALLAGPATAVRVVLTPEASVVADTRRTLTALALHGYWVDALVANRVLPDEPTAYGSWAAGHAAQQRAQLAQLARDTAPLPLLVAPVAAHEPVGVAALSALGEQLYGEAWPAQEAPPGELVRLERDGDGFLLSVALPLARLAELDLARSGDELVLTVAGQRRLLTLPSVLRRCAATGARLVDGHLVVAFTPDPAQWWQR